MAFEFELPDVGEGVAEGEIVQWLVGPGEHVTEDQPLVEVETDKAVVEVPSPVNGHVKEIRAEVGEVVPVGSVLIVIDPDDEAEMGADIEAEPEEVAESRAGDSTTDASVGDGDAAERDADGEDRETATAEAEGSDRVFASPSARRVARELGVDITTVEGSGPAGRVSEEDVRAAASGDDGTGEAETGSAAETTAGGESADTAATVGEASGAATETAGTAGDGDEPDEAGATATDAGAADASTAGTAADRDRTLAAPATRRLAEEEDVDIDAVPATEQRDGQPYVTPEAVREYAESQRAAQAADAEAISAGAGDAGSASGAAVAAGEEERIPYRGIRRTIGDRMAQSAYTAPHVTHHDRVDVTALVETRADLKPRAEERGISLSYLPFVMKAVVAALREFPILNSQLDEENEEIVKKGYYNLGVATATDAGLMVPVVDSVDEKSLLQLASETNELVEKARDRSISREEMQGGTFTITNFGAIGGEYATPIINYPETAILGLGSLEQRPTVVDGEVVARHVLPLSLSIDHRVIDGAEAAQFTNRLMEYLANPTLLLLE